MRHLVVIDAGGSLVLVDVLDGIRMPIGTPLAPGGRTMVTTAVWSLEGQWTAWSVDSSDTDGLRQIRLHDETLDDDGVLVDAVRAFYLYPSPDGRRLSHLSPGPLGLELAVIDIRSRDVHVIERGQPLFWAWSRDGREIAIHVADRVIVTDPTGTSRRVLTDDTDPFVAPAWLPGDSVVYMRAGKVVATGDDGVEHVLAEDCVGRFALDPEGRRMAYLTTAEGAPPGSADVAEVVILDLLTRTITPLDASGVAGFFWSPDGRRLAILEVARGGHLRWVVYDDRGSTTRFAPFLPGRTWASSVLPFFEQYAHSHAQWSPDSTRLIVPAVGDDGEPGALIHTVATPDEAEWVGDVDLAWWG